MNRHLPRWAAAFLLIGFPAIAFAGNGYTPFHYVACSLEGLSEGHLGALIAILALLAGSGFYYLTKNMIFVPISIAIALILYFTPTAINDFFGITVQTCSMSQAVGGQHYQQNFEMCDRSLTQTEAQTGEYCTCGGSSSAPSCQSYESVCDQQLASDDNSTQYCSCATANATQETSPVCESYPAGSKTAYTATLETECYSTISTWNSAPYCEDTDIPHQASGIGPVADFYAPVAPFAYYTMQTVIDNNTGAPIIATWYGDSDDIGWYYANGQQVAYSPPTASWQDLVQQSITLQPGNNTLDVTVENDDLGNPNTPNPSGTVDEIVGSGGIVYSGTGGSSDSWYEVSGPPSSPNPPPPQTPTDCYTTSCAP